MQRELPLQNGHARPDFSRKQLPYAADRIHECIDLGLGIPERQRRAAGRRNPVKPHQRMRAMMAGTHGHTFLINDYATGRRMNPIERLIFAAAARYEKCASAFEEFGTREIRPQQFMPRMLPRALAVNTRHALAR